MLCTEPGCPNEAECDTDDGYLCNECYADYVAALEDHLADSARKRAQGE